ncbi:MAG: tetratricopeptide repeat protein [Chryseobacterium sp.]|nr:tetratricopeptide repeat protein [Chryseobacterium sp.]
MEDFFENELAKKFEEMIENNDEFYFDTEELEDIIIYYLELGDISYADLAVTYGLKIHPQSTEIKIKKLEVLLELEDYHQAKQLIDELKHASEEHTDFLVCCAKYYSNLGNPAKSIAYCERALALGEEENFLHNFIADEYVNLGDPFNALKNYKKALKFDPNDEYSFENCLHCFYSLKKYEEALSFLNNYLDQFPFSETAWYEYGQYFYNRKNYEEAIKGFDYLLAINSGAVGVYGNKAACYEALKDWEKAIKVYEEMLELEHTKAFTFYKIGLCYKEMKQLVPALAHFQKTLIEDPQFYHAMVEQSIVYEELGGMKEALYFAKEAASYNENNVEFLKRLAYLSIQMGEMEESEQCLRKMVQKEPDLFYNWYAYIEILMILGEFSDALEVLQEAVILHHRAELYYQMSNCWYHLKDSAKGKKFLDHALGLDATIVEDMGKKYPYIKEAVKKSKTKKK